MMCLQSGKGNNDIMAKSTPSGTPDLSEADLSGIAEFPVMRLWIDKKQNP
jgi:hypothetical protein